MDMYIRTNDEGERVIDYDLLDVAARANFAETIVRWAGEIDLWLGDGDFTDAEKTACCEDAVNVELDNLYLDDDVSIEPETRVWMHEVMLRKVADTHGVELPQLI